MMLEKALMSMPKFSLRIANVAATFAGFGALIGLLACGSVAEARDLTGVWASDAAVCKKIFKGTGSNVSFTKDADVYGSGFMYQGNRLKGKIAACAIKTVKEDGDVVNLIATCSTDVALETVQFSFKIDNDNQITRFFPGVSELKTEYHRCSL
jgi:hypothetical protein